jgi:holo-[acyl-carrier protein] synthase
VFVIITRLICRFTTQVPQPRHVDDRSSASGDSYVPLRPEPVGNFAITCDYLNHPHCRTNRNREPVSEQRNSPIATSTAVNEGVHTTVTLVTGFDIQPIDEVRESIERFGDRYLKRIYSDRELDECRANAESLARTLALRFAAKEAVLKVLRPDDHIPSWRSIEVLLRVGGGPRIALRGEAAERAGQIGVRRMLLSVSLSRECGIATVLADLTGT